MLASQVDRANDILSTLISFVAFFYGIGMIIEPISKESRSARKIKEEFLPAYSKRTGLLLVVMGIFLFVYTRIDKQALYHNVWFIVGTSVIMVAFLAGSIYLARKYKA